MYVEIKNPTKSKLSTEQSMRTIQYIILKNLVRIIVVIRRNDKNGKSEI